MRLVARRSLVITAVVLSLLLGVASIRVASRLTALAAAPTAPPVSLAALQSQLDAERARSATLEQQLADLLDAAGSLSTALDTTQDQVSLDGLTAKQLRDRLASAQAKLSAVTELLAQAEARLAATGGGSGSSGATPAPANPGGGATPTPAQSTTPSLALALVSGTVQATWSSCPSAQFAGAALVRSTDSEIHYPPEDNDTVVANVTTRTTTSATDASPPSGTLTYRLYCLTSSGGETRVGTRSSSRSITVP